jgi:multidrug resistance efflux pump
VRARSTRPWPTYLLAMLCVAAIVVAYAVVGPASQSSGQSARTTTVKRGVVQSTVSGSGTLSAAAKVGVNFASSGTLERVYVSAGQHVYAGELLAEIDPISAKSSLRLAEMDLANEEAAYQEAVEGLTPVEQRQDSISAAQAHASVSSAKQSLAQAEESARSDAATARAAVAQSEQSLKATEQSVKLEAKSQQDSVSQAIAQREADQKSLGEAKTQLSEAKAALETAKADSGSAGSNSEKAKPETGQSALSAAESKVSAAESAVKSDEAKVVQDNNSIASEQNNQAAVTLKDQQSIASARNAVANAKQSQATTELKDRQSIAQEHTNVKSAELSLQSTLAANEAKAAPPTNSTVVSAENSVKSAELSVENARRTLEETKLYAPAEGVVASIKNSVGEAVTGTGSGSAGSSDETGSTGSSGTAGNSSHSATGGTSGSTATSSATSGTSGTAGSGSHGGAVGAGGTSGAGGASGSGNAGANGAGDSGTSGTGASTPDGSEGGNLGSGNTPAKASDAFYAGGGALRDIADPSGTGTSGAGSGAGASSSGSSGEGSSSSSSFIELVDLRGYQLVVTLSESEILRVHMGQIATVTVEALEGRKFAAHVTDVAVLSSSSSSSGSSGAVSYDVTFQLDQTESGLKPGMSATAEIVVSEAEGINVPTSAIKAGSVTVLRGGKQVTQSVSTGMAGNSSTIVLSGLNVGETVVLPTVSTGTGSSSSLFGGRGISRSGLGGLGGGLGKSGFPGGGGGVFISPAGGPP